MSNDYIHLLDVKAEVDLDLLEVLEIRIWGNWENFG